VEEIEICPFPRITGISQQTMRPVIHIHHFRMAKAHGARGFRLVAKRRVNRASYVNDLPLRDHAPAMKSCVSKVAVPLILPAMLPVTKLTTTR